MRRFLGELVLIALALGVTLVLVPRTGQPGWYVRLMGAAAGFLSALLLFEHLRRD